MNRRLFVVASLAVVAVVLIGPAPQLAETSAAAQKGRIEGSVVTVQPYPNGTPLSGWRVLLGTNECKLISSTTTDAHGVYRFSNLDRGEYVIELAFDQPYGQGWEMEQPTMFGNSCSYGRVNVEAGTTATGPQFKVNLISDPRGYFGSLFYDVNENGQRDNGEKGVATSFIEYDIDMMIQFESDMEGNFRKIESATPVPGNPIKPPLNLTTCPAYPQLANGVNGHRVTAPIPNSCGTNGCVTKVSDQVFHCEDYGVYEVDPNPAIFSGEAWVDAAPVTPGTKAIAWIGGVDCGEGYVFGTSQISWYNVIVRSSATRAGCGIEGAEVRFTLGEQNVPVIGHWHLRTLQQVQQDLDLIIGPPFALYSLSIWTDERAPQKVQAYVGDTFCAEADSVRGGIAPNPTAIIVVPSETMRPGCGREGATVRFVVGGVPYAETAPWTPGRQNMRLATPATSTPTFKPPETGSGGLLPH